jgi:hypothetical protein
MSESTVQNELENKYLEGCPNCHYGNGVHIPYRENETILNYWNRCCGEYSKDSSSSLKIVHGVVRFKNLLNNEEVTKEFTVTDNSIQGYCQYIDENISIWNQIWGGTSCLIRIKSKYNSIFFLEQTSKLCIYRVDSV